MKNGSAEEWYGGEAMALPGSHHAAGHMPPVATALGVQRKAPWKQRAPEKRRAVKAVAKYLAQEGLPLWRVNDHMHELLNELTNGCWGKCDRRTVDLEQKRQHDEAQASYRKCILDLVDRGHGMCIVLDHWSNLRQKMGYLGVKICVYAPASYAGTRPGQVGTFQPASLRHIPVACAPCDQPVYAKYVARELLDKVCHC